MITIKQLFILVFYILYVASAQAESAPNEYIKQPGVSGAITSVGSDTLANLMTTWSVEFRNLYPQVKFQIQASGSSTAPPALTEGTANIGPMSRELNTSEINSFRRKHGYQPFAVKVAIDAIAIFVDNNNPLEQITLEQLDSIFSITRFCGSRLSTIFWKDLDPESPYKNRKIKVFGRNSVSGTYGLFKQRALCEGDFKATVNELPGSSSVVQSVAFSNGAIGYAAYGQRTAAVKALAISNNDKRFVEANRQTIASGEYPLTRFLYLVVNKPANNSLPLLEQEFIRFVLSQRGQDIVQREGYMSMPKSVVNAQLNSLFN